MADNIYENLLKYTFDALQREALNSIADDVDKREGSVLYDATAPCAYIVSQCMNVLYQVALQSRIQTANGQYLDLCASQNKIYRGQATPAKWIIRVSPSDVEIRIGKKFISSTGLNLVYRVQSATDVIGEYVVVCETEGVQGGRDFGVLEEYPIEHILDSVEFVKCIDGGRDVESDAAFRLRWWSIEKSKGYGGNFDDYKTWILFKFAQDGGFNFDACYIFPAWQGGGTVKIVPTIADAQNGACSIPNALAIDALKQWLDPVGDDGFGAGYAPVGHAVTCEAPSSIDFDLKIIITMKTGKTLTNDLKSAIERGVRTYFAEQRIESAITLTNEFKHDYIGIIAPSLIIATAAEKSQDIDSVSVLRSGEPFIENFVFNPSSARVELPFVSSIEIEEA